jgi:hypothetical protein
MSLFFIGEHFFECRKSVLPFFSRGKQGIYDIVEKDKRIYKKI